MKPNVHFCLSHQIPRNLTFFFCFFTCCLHPKRVVPDAYEQWVSHGLSILHPYILQLCYNCHWARYCLLPFFITFGSIGLPLNGSNMPLDEDHLQVFNVFYFIFLLFLLLFIYFFLPPPSLQEIFGILTIAIPTL